MHYIVRLTYWGTGITVSFNGLTMGKAFYSLILYIIGISCDKTEVIFYCIADVFECVEWDKIHFWFRLCSLF